MSSRKYGPFPRLFNLDIVDANEDDMDALLERAYLINEVLAEAGCCCNGHARGHQRDEFWGGDLSDIVARCTPHYSYGEEEPIRLKLETLCVVVDDNNEIMSWQYEEGRD